MKDNPLNPLDGTRKYLCSMKDDSSTMHLYIRIVTNIDEMKKRLDCTDLLADISRKRGTYVDDKWKTNYEQSLRTKYDSEKGLSSKSSEQNFTYFVLENEEGKALGVASGDFYPNEAFKTRGYPKVRPDAELLHVRNFVIDEKYADLLEPLRQMFLSKIFSISAKRHGTNMYMTGVISDASLLYTPWEKSMYEQFASKVEGLTSSFVLHGSAMAADPSDPSSTSVDNKRYSDNILLIRKDKGVDMDDVTKRVGAYRKEIIGSNTARLNIDQQKKAETKGVFKTSR